MKRAFIIGLNYASEEYALSGCEFDADNLYRRMTAAGIPKKNITVAKGEISASDLFDILAGWSVSSKPTDTTYITFSGHGTQIPGPEADGYDEALCLYDRPNGITLLKDNDLAAMLSRIEGNVFVILDSCYSGGMERSAAPPMYQDMKRKFISFDPAFPVFTPDKAKTAPRSTVRRQYNLFACAESEVSWDTGGGGVFTSSLVYHFDKGRHGIGAIMRGCVDSCKGLQTPSYKIRGGTAAKRLFM